MIKPLNEEDFRDSEGLKRHPTGAELAIKLNEAIDRINELEAKYEGHRHNCVGTISSPPRHPEVERKEEPK